MYIIKDLDVSTGIGTRSSTNRTLIDRDDLIGNSNFVTNAGRVAGRTELVQSLKATTANWKKAELLSQLEAANVPASPINSIGEAFEDPQIKHRSLQIKNDGVGGVRTPIVSRGQPMASLSSAPKLGEHNASVADKGWNAG